MDIEGISCLLVRGPSCANNPQSIKNLGAEGQQYDRLSRGTATACSSRGVGCKGCLPQPRL